MQFYDILLKNIVFQLVKANKSTRCHCLSVFQPLYVQHFLFIDKKVSDIANCITGDYKNVARDVVMAYPMSEILYGMVKKSSL